MATSIETRGLGKRYQLGTDAPGYDTLRDALVRTLGRVRRERSELWALRDLHLDVEEGQALGIIGRNGAGKTTLLKVLAGITEPSAGHARTRGRVGALLDVGTGFHPELTGRENIYLTGAILGLGRAPVQRRLDEIVEFAGVGQFLDTPVKRYSSGMRLRLGFAVAAHIEPPIIVVDEVLAVGDAAFQEKCLGKVSEIGRHGRTVLFVSHDLGAVSRVCPQAIWLDEGRLRQKGATAEVISAYLDAGPGQPLVATFVDQPNASVALVGAALKDLAGHVLVRPRRGDPLAAELDMIVRQPTPGLDVRVSVINSAGLRLINDLRSDWNPESMFLDEPGSYRLTVGIPPVLLPGRYAVDVILGSDYEVFVEREVLTFTIEARPEDRRESLERARVVQPSLSWRTDHRPQG